MAMCSDFLNRKSIGVVQIFGNASGAACSYIANMAARFDWYIQEWMKALDDMSQADLMRLTGYPKAKVSDLVTGKQRYNREILNEIAHALNIRPYELLMHPADAMAIRRVRDDAKKIAAVTFEDEKAVNE